MDADTREARRIIDDWITRHTGMNPLQRYMANWALALETVADTIKATFTVTFTSGVWLDELPAPVASLVPLTDTLTKETPK